MMITFREDIKLTGNSNKSSEAVFWYG